MQSPRWVLSDSESIFFKRLNAVPEWQRTPEDSDEVAANKARLKLRFLVDLYEGIQTDVFRQFEMIMSDHVRVIDGELIWDAKMNGDATLEARLTIERQGIVYFFKQFAGLPQMIRGIQSEIDALDVPVNPELHSPEGQDNPVPE